MGILFIRGIVSPILSDLLFYYDDFQDFFQVLKNSLQRRKEKY